MPLLKQAQVFGMYVLSYFFRLLKYHHFDCAAEDLNKDDLEVVEGICREVFENSPQVSLVYSALASKIRDRLDKELSPKKGWNVVVGRNFGAFVTQKIKCYAYLSVFTGVNILLWKV